MNHIMARGSIFPIRLVTVATAVALAVGLMVSGIERAHAAREKVSPDKACSNGTSCFAVLQTGPGEGIVAHSQLGNAVESHSLNGNGLFGDTHNQSGTSKVCASGVVGLDLSQDGGTLNFGVSGRSYHGTGVLGLSGTGPGATGTSKRGDGVEGNSESGWGGNFHSVAFGGLLGSSTKGTGVMAMSNSSVHPALSVRALGTGPLVDAHDSSDNSVMSLDQQGDLTIAGTLTTGGSCHVGCSKTRDGNGVSQISYAPRESAPTMEDFGEAQLVAGAAFVRLDPAFANAIDSTKSYLVFITPDGETKGLYIAMRSASGFEVRENGAGRANVQFSYRIVAKPYGADAPRLPLVRTTRSL
jgi:hypothetical protein